jgi:hypothetical protein
MTTMRLAGLHQRSDAAATLTQRGLESMIVVASVGGRGGISTAMATMQRGGSAFDAVIAGIEASECSARPTNPFPPAPADHESTGYAAAPSRKPGGARPDVWSQWRRQLSQEMHLESNALARMEWLTGLASVAVGAGEPADTISIVARDGTLDIVCGVSARAASDATRRVVLSLRSGQFLGDALRDALASLEALGTPLYERINLHALARERIPLGASHRRGETFLYLRAEMSDYAERPCLFVP